MMTHRSSFPDSYSPLTSSIGFIRAPLEDVVGALSDWRSQIHGHASVEDLHGSLKENLYRLEPLTGGVRPRELVVSTRNPEWTALFDCGIQGGDQTTTVGFLCSEMQVHGVVVTSIPDVPASAGVERYGARQFEMFGPLRTEFLNYVRTVSVVRDGQRWRFDAAGTVQDFEDVAAYSSRRVADRLTPQMLVRYSAALGLRPFEEDFYTSPSALIVSSISVPPGGLSMTLAAARTWAGIAAP